LQKNKKRIKNLVRKMKMNSKYNMNNKIYKICLTIVNILILKKGDDVIIDIIDGIVKIERNIDDDDYIRIINKMLNEFERNKDNIYFLFKITLSHLTSLIEPPINDFVSKLSILISLSECFEYCSAIKTPYAMKPKFFLILSIFCHKYF
jgi:hypothetical protein